MTATTIDPPSVKFETMCEPEFESTCAHCGLKWNHRTVVPWLLMPDSDDIGTICPFCMSDDVLTAYIGELQSAAAGKKPEWGWTPSEEDQTAAQSEARVLSSYLPEIKARHAAQPDTWLYCVVMTDGEIAPALQSDATPDADLPDLDPDIWGEVLDL